MINQFEQKIEPRFLKVFSVYDWTVIKTHEEA